MDVKEEAILGERIGDHWYYAAKGRALCDFLGGHAVDEVLDVGAGSGVFTRRLLDAGLAQRGTCVDTAYDSDRIENHGGHQIRFLRATDEVSPSLVLMMDVLEHVDDDVGLLRACTDRMPDDGRVLITVPAFQFLWSGHDVFLEHRRRYTLRQIEAVVAQAGLRVVKARYFFAALFPLVAALRLRDRWRLRAGQVEAKSQLRPASGFVNRTLVAVHDLERASLFRVNRLAGLTVFCLARRA